MLLCKQVTYIHKLNKIETDKAGVMKTGKVCQKTCNWNMPQNNYTVHHFTKDICTDNRYDIKLSYGLKINLRIRIAV